MEKTNIGQADLSHGDCLVKLSFQPSWVERSTRPSSCLLPHRSIKRRRFSWQWKTHSVRLS